MEKKIDERTFDFALKVVDLYKYLTGNKEYILSKQMLRAGTSIGANVQEAQAAQSKADFISKMSIASKETRETKYWLRLLSKSGYLNGYSRKAETLAEVDSIINIITKIVKTTSQKKDSTNPKLNTQNFSNKANHPKPKTLFNWGLPRSSGRWYWGLRKKQKSIIQWTSPTLAPFLSSGKL